MKGAVMSQIYLNMVENYMSKEQFGALIENKLKIGTSC